jgi:transaldolase
MEIFVDSANIKEITKWLEYGIADGVTTNPSIMFKDGIYDIEKGAKEIARLIRPRPLSVEVTSNDLEEMFEQAKEFASWADNIVIKIPQINTDGVPCYGIIKRLETAGIRVNATAALSFGQVMLAAKANATYVSIFAGRITDEGGDASLIIRNSVEWLRLWKYPSKTIIGSIRSVGDVITAALAGAHIITIPPQFIDKMADHKNTRATVEQFLGDAEKAMELMHQEEALKIPS